MDDVSLKEQVRVFARERADIVAVYLYGSQAKGQARPDSDVDLAVLMCPGARDYLRLEMALEAALNRQLNNDNLEVMVLNHAPLLMRFEILSTGRLLHSNDEPARTDWEVETLSDYWDWEPFVREYNRAFFQRLTEGFSDAQQREYHRARAAFAVAPITLKE